jgi:lycopene beta-cyclase
MIDSKQFIKKTFLLIDKQPKNTNDRTWCYWEKEQGYFENIVYKTWKNLSFISDDEIIKLDIAPYSYKMVRGIDFYDYCFKKISQQKNISIVYGDVVITEGKNSYVTLEGKPLTTAKALVFNSISTTHVETSYHSLLQHFKGWFIETSADAFNNEQATLMDFSLSQHNGATFAYVLPFTATKALVEYTLFSSSLLQQDEYDKALRHYIEFNLNLKDYTITETEFGVIPMTNQLFQFYNNGMYNIGTVGGNTKPSTGYTFHFIAEISFSLPQQ